MRLTNVAVLSLALAADPLCAKAAVQAPPSLSVARQAQAKVATSLSAKRRRLHDRISGARLAELLRETVILKISNTAISRSFPMRIHSGIRAVSTTARTERSPLIASAIAFRPPRISVTPPPFRAQRSCNARGTSSIGSSTPISRPSGTAFSSLKRRADTSTRVSSDATAPL
jgi:hypothetical protein